MKRHKTIIHVADLEEDQVKDVMERLYNNNIKASLVRKEGSVVMIAAKFFMWPLITIFPQFIKDRFQEIQYEDTKNDLVYAEEPFWGEEGYSYPDEE